jgi:hypothetical protein
MIGFGQEIFCPQLAQGFIFKVIIRTYVEMSRLSAVGELLEDDIPLAAHSTVFLLTQSYGLQYKWFHNQIRPFGQQIALQCSKCLALRSLQVQFSADGKSSELKCRLCKATSREIECDGEYVWPKHSMKVGVAYKPLWGEVEF